MRISDWSSDVCSSDLGRWRRPAPSRQATGRDRRNGGRRRKRRLAPQTGRIKGKEMSEVTIKRALLSVSDKNGLRSEEHTSELQSLMRISYAVFCLKKKKKKLSQSTTDKICINESHQ